MCGRKVENRMTSRILYTGLVIINVEMTGKQIQEEKNMRLGLEGKLSILF